MAGADLVSTDLAQTLTSNGLAMLLDDLEAADGPGQLLKKHKTDDSSSRNAHSVMNVKNNVYRRDSSPLQPGCLCHACRSHSRAYLHHLMRAHELLGEVGQT